MIAAIDGDYIPYLCAGSSKVEDRYYVVAEGDDAPPLFTAHYKKDVVEYCNSRCIPLDWISQARHVIDERAMYQLIDAEFEDIFRNTGAPEYELYLGGKEKNFRYDIYPDYKKSREKYSRPVLLAQAKEYLCEKYNAELCNKIEADDAVSILCSTVPDSILCSPDKDLDQVPGKHYDPYKGEVYIIDEDMALQCLYTQILMGDSTDGIPGVKGVGIKTAMKIMDKCKTEQDMWKACLKAHKSEEAANLTANLVYTLRNHGEHWSPPC